MKTTKNTTKKQTAATAILGAMATDAKAKASTGKALTYAQALALKAATVVPESAQVTEGAPGAGGSKPKAKAKVKTQPTVQATAKALFNEIENLVAGAGPLVVKLPVEAFADESAAKLAQVEELPTATPAQLMGEVEGEKTAAAAAQEVKEVKTKKKAVKKAAKAEKVAKAPKPEPSKELKVRLYGKGEFYFGKLASERIGSFPHIAVTVEGKKITLTPTKSAKDSIPVGACHAAKVLRAAKALADTGWSKETQDLVAQPVGEAGFLLEVR
jgi:hypothetical protein